MTVISEHLDSATWWQRIHDLSETPIRDLIEGFDEIADQAIPYVKLPGRARTFYGAQSREGRPGRRTMSSSGTQPPRRDRYGARHRDRGARGRDPGPLHPDRRGHGRRDGHPQTARSTHRLRLQSALGARMGAAPTNHPGDRRPARRAPNQRAAQPTRAYGRFRELLADPAHAAVVDYAEGLRLTTRPLTRKDTAEQALKELGLDLATDAGQMLLHLAGPYSCKDTWLENSAAEGLATAGATLDAAFTRAGATTTASLILELDKFGIPQHTAIDFINSRPGLRRVGEMGVLGTHHRRTDLSRLAPIRRTGLSRTHRRRHRRQLQ